jgi:CRP-like cAMP-binding protein
MLAQMATVSYASGQAVFRQGDPADKVYLVAAGELDVGTEARPSAGGGAAEAAAAPADEAKASGDGGGGASSVRRSASNSGFRVVARLGPGDHFGETALLEERNQRNATVRCTSPICELREMPNEAFKKFMRESSQLAASVHAAAVNRNNLRVRKVIRAAEEDGKATIHKYKPGDVIFNQGDRSDAFYLVESGAVQMSLMPAIDFGEADGTGSGEDLEPIPVRQYQPGDCFGASGLLPGDNVRRNTATAIGEVTLKAIPHNHFRVMLRDDKFLKAGIQANDVLYRKWKESNAHPEANASELVTGEIADELLDEVVQKAQRR